MAYDASFGEDPRGTWCLACRKPVEAGQPATRIDFQHDPHGKSGVSGLYHTSCARPYQSLARIINMKIGF